VVPGFAEERQLGSGASGRVVAAVHAASGTRVAVKYLSPRLLQDPQFLDRFREEARLLRSLGNAHVVRLYDYVEAPGQAAAIVMELVDGVSLHEMITRQGPTGAGPALLVLKGSLLGLAAAHALGIVHRDYKPENVLVDAQGESRLTDFGIATRQGASAPAGGTPLYMAPEQWDAAPVTAATDIYAATIVFFECLTGLTPFSGELGQLQLQHAFAAVPVELIDEPLRDLVTRGMAKSPEDRPPSAADFIIQLEATATAAYGSDWEDHARAQLAGRAAALLLLLLHGQASTAIASGTGTTHASSVLAAPKAAAAKAGGLSGWQLAAVSAGVAVVTAAAVVTGGMLAASPAGTAACSISSLKLAVDWAVGQAAAGRFYVPLELTNTSGQACTLYGYPGVAVTTGTAPGSQVGAEAIRLTSHPLSGTDAPATIVTLAPGATASATLQIVNVTFYDSSACGPVSVSYLQVYPPGQTSAAYVPYTHYTQLACSKPIYQLGITAVEAGAGG
jgi:serine/threonine-protein kinase